MLKINTNFFNYKKDAWCKVGRELSSRCVYRETKYPSLCFKHRTTYKMKQHVKLSLKREVTQQIWLWKHQQTLPDLHFRLFPVCVVHHVTSSAAQAQEECVSALFAVHRVIFIIEVQDVLLCLEAELLVEQHGRVARRYVKGHILSHTCLQRRDRKEIPVWTRAARFMGGGNLGVI